MFNMESRGLLNLSVQDALDCISENFNIKNFSGGACARNFLKKCAVRSSDGRYHAHIATVYYISRPPLSPNPPSAPDVRSQKRFSGNPPSRHGREPRVAFVLFTVLLWMFSCSEKWSKLLNPFLLRSDFSRVDCEQALWKVEENLD